MRFIRCCGLHSAIPIAAAVLTIYGFMIRTVQIMHDQIIYNKTKGGTGSFDGKFCIMPFVTTASGHDQSDVTLVTQGSTGYLGKLVTTSGLWNGPVSVALYIPHHSDLFQALTLVHSLSVCLSDFRKKVSAHLFYPVESAHQCIESYNDNFMLDPTSVNCTDIMITVNSLSLKRVKWYPVNLARNIARKGASTKLMLIADIELYPSARLSESFQNFYHSGRNKFSTKDVFVLPVFEVHLNETMPSDKLQLSHLVARGKAVPFHIDRLAYECHRIPNLSQWWNSGDKTGDKMDLYKSTKWIRPCWEPVFISDNQVPGHDERFRGYGKNKIQQVCMHITVSTMVIDRRNKVSFKTVDFFLSQGCTLYDTRVTKIETIIHLTFFSFTKCADKIIPFTFWTMHSWSIST